MTIKMRSSTKLLIDQGNSFLKWALIKNENFNLASTGICRTLEDFQQSIKMDLNSLLGIDEIWISSVARQNDFDGLTTILSQQEPLLRFATTPSASSQPYLINGYSCPAQLGIDRWLGLLAVGHHYGYPCVLVDAGSALTIDYVDSTGVHQGGWILPGLNKSIGCLTSQTSLSSINSTLDGFLSVIEGRELVFGTQTQQGVYAGIVAGAVGAIEKFIETVVSRSGNLANLPSLQCISCGGEAPTLQPLLGSNWKYDKDLVLKGLALYVQSCHAAD